MDLRVLTADKVQVCVLFYRPASDDPLLNRLVAFFDGPFCHCEIALLERIGEEPWDRVVWGSSIYQNEPVFYRQKTYKRDGYVSIAIEISIPQMHRIRTFCRMHAERQTTFSLQAMYAAYLPVQLVRTDATFCSKHVAQALQYAAVPGLQDVNAALMTPSRLYSRLKQSAIMQVVPSRMPPPTQGGDNGRMRSMHTLEKMLALPPTQRQQQRRDKPLPPARI